jgi:uncharacterized membrane protein (Fun14 family)
MHKQSSLPHKNQFLLATRLDILLALLSNIIPFAGSGLLGYAMGFGLKKILKWMLIIVGFLTGIFFAGVQVLQKYGYVSTVNWDYLP